MNSFMYVSNLLFAYYLCCALSFSQDLHIYFLKNYINLGWRKIGLILLIISNANLNFVLVKNKDENNIHVSVSLLYKICII